jgi:hypothetical protein
MTMVLLLVTASAVVFLLDSAVVERKRVEGVRWLSIYSFESN